jgi:cytochrome c-type biogenesis protein CcmH/NrfG
LARDPQNHLSLDELADLAAETESSAQADVGREHAKAHAEGCAICGQRLRDHLSVQAMLGTVANSVTGERMPDCPAKHVWLTFAAGLSSAAQSQSLLEHASQCDYCGQMLCAATEDMNPEISAEEQELIRQLPSGRPKRQRELARKIVEMEGASEKGAVPARAESVVAAPGNKAKASVGGRLRGTPQQERWRFANWTGWAVPVGVLAVVIAGSVVFVEYSSPSLSSVNKMIAQAYTEQRPMELRFPGAGYGPVRQQRGELGPSRSRMDEPPELLEAETTIERGLAKHPNDPRWLQAKARTDLFEGNYQAAIEKLQKAENQRPEDMSIKVDLASAYYGKAAGQADAASRDAGYELALQELNNVLGRNPKDLVALFNRAEVYERMGQHIEAGADWERYIGVDAKGEWAAEARRISAPH